jgi:hypothetical protein
MRSRIADRDLVDLHLVAGEMHQARRDRGLGAEADAGQVRRDELRAAADVGLGEHRAVLHRAFGRAPQVAAIVQQGDQHAEQGAARAEAIARGAGAVVAVHQAGHGEGHVQRMAHVVVERVAGEVARVLALEQRLEVGEGAHQRRGVDAGIAGAVQRQHRIPDPRRILDVDPVGHVVLV